MLSFKISSHEPEKRPKTTQIRHSESWGELVVRAARSLGIEKSVFLRAAIEKEAERVLTESTRHVFSPEDATAFMAALEIPPAPTPKALAAMKDYRSHIVHAD